jgi:hypothetical protein
MGVVPTACSCFVTASCCSTDFTNHLGERRTIALVVGRSCLGGLDWQHRHIGKC